MFSSDRFLLVWFIGRFGNRQWITGPLLFVRTRVAFYWEFNIRNITVISDHNRAIILCCFTTFLKALNRKKHLEKIQFENCGFYFWLAAGFYLYIGWPVYFWYLAGIREWILLNTKCTSNWSYSCFVRFVESKPLFFLSSFNLFGIFEFVFCLNSGLWISPIDILHKTWKQNYAWTIRPQETLITASFLP